MLRTLLINLQNPGKCYKTFTFARNLTAMPLQKAYINGEWVTSSTNDAFQVKNPATGHTIADVPNMTVDDAQKAINSAKETFNSDEWRLMTAKQRSDMLKKWHAAIQASTATIADIMTAESGKPINESLGELAYGNSFIEWFAEEARRIYGEVIPSALPNREILVLKQPMGVAGLITPWNFPLAMITRKAGAALAAGCTVVIKPSEDTPLTCLMLAKLAEEAGIPKGAFNVVTTNNAAPIGDLLCASPDVATISFTGSTEVGKLLYRKCSEHVKRVSLELGGNAPFIVFESANLEKAVDGAITSKFRNCGQTCVASNRFFVQAPIFDSFVEALKKRVEDLKIGPGINASCHIGPLINKMQFNKVFSYVDDARNKGAKIVTGGHGHPELGELYYAPTIVADVTPAMKLYNDEVFGPVISLIKFTDEKDAMLQANNTRRGLAGYFYSNDIQQVFRVAKRLEVGMVGVNEGLISAAEVPFGGIKESGIGREGGRQGIEEYVDTKYICMGNLQN